MSIAGDDAETVVGIENMRIRVLYLTMYPILLVLGTVGNVLAVAVMMRKKNRKHAISWYIAILSLSDTLFLYSTIPWVIFYYHTNEMVDISVYARCTLDYFTYYFSFEYSAWVLVLMSIERFISIVHPLKAKVLATPRRAKQMCLFLVVILAAINAYHLTSRKVYYWDGVPYCGKRPEHVYITNYVWPILDAVIYSYLPSILMFTFNGIIMYHMWSSKNQAALNQQGAMAKNFPRVTKMLLSVSFFFICTTVPVETMFIVRNYSDSYNALLYSCLDALMVLNHSANFYLYCLSTRKFRQDLKAIFCAHQVHPIGTNTTSQQPTAVHSLDAS